MKKINSAILGLVAAACVAVPVTSAAAPAEKSLTEPSAQTAKYDVNSSVWQTLPSGQRDTLKGLFSQKQAIDNSIIRKYREYGLISEEKAAKLEEKIGEMTKDTPRMPFIGKNHKGK